MTAEQGGIDPAKVLADHRTHMVTCIPTDEYPRQLYGRCLPYRLADLALTAEQLADDEAAAWRQRAEAAEALALDLQGKVARMGDAITDTCWKATQYGETADGDTLAYIIPKGTVHRLIGAAQSSGIPAVFRAALADQPEQDEDDAPRAGDTETGPVSPKVDPYLRSRDA